MPQCYHNWITTHSVVDIFTTVSKAFKVYHMYNWFCCAENIVEQSGVL